MSSAFTQLKAMAADSLRIQTESKLVRVDDEPEASKISYLNIHGTPEAFRWLSQLLNELASSVENPKGQTGGRSVIVSPHDLGQITMDQWHSIELFCGQTLAGNSDPIS